MNIEGRDAYECQVQNRTKLYPNLISVAWFWIRSWFSLRTTNYMLSILKNNYIKGFGIGFGYDFGFKMHF